jgi:sugar-specific transcriptional regulator TrmB
LSEKVIDEILRDYGLTEKESKIYVFLAKSDAQKAYNICKSLGMHKVQVYRALHNLESKGLVESTFERPMRFFAFPFDDLLDSLVQKKKDEAKSLLDKKSQVLSHWRSISTTCKPMLEKFMVISGEKNIHTRIFQMIQESKEEFLLATSNLGVIQADQVGIIEAIQKRKLPFRILTDISRNNLEIAKKITKSPATCVKHINIKEDHANQFQGFWPRFVVKDTEEAIFFLTLRDNNTSSISREDTGFWTNSKAFVYAIKKLFEELWANSTNVDVRMREIITGKPSVETIIVKDPREAYEKFYMTLDAAKEDMINITSSKGLVRFSKAIESYPIKNCLERGIKIRIMTPVDKYNLETAKKLSEFCEIKHTDINYLRMAIIDKKHFFQFKVPPLNKETTDPLHYFDNMLCTNDPEYVEKMNEMLNDLWERNKQPLQVYLQI